jgi:hypothetical protein
MEDFIAPGRKDEPTARQMSQNGEGFALSRRPCRKKRQPPNLWPILLFIMINDQTCGVSDTRCAVSPFWNPMSLTGSCDEGFRD